MDRKYVKRILIACTLLGALFNYNNCGGGFSPADEVSSSSIGSTSTANKYWTCADNLDDMSLFEKTYHPFLQNTCVTCHSGAGPGPGAFASSGPLVALNSFNALGFAKINTRALDGHSPASGKQNKSTIDLLSAKYVAGLQMIEKCKGSDADPLAENQDSADRIQLKPKVINASTTKIVQVEWDLQADSIAPATGSTFNPAQFAGMKLVADVQIFQRPGIVNYVVGNPRIYTSNGDVHVESLLFKVNGTPTPAQRAFYLVKTDIRAWNAAHPDFTRPDPDPTTPYNDYEYRARLISGGALIMLGQIKSTDTLSVSIAKLDRITLPAPEPGPAVRFSQTTMQVTEGYQIISIPIELSKPSVGVNYAEVKFEGDTTVKDECCRQTVNDDGMKILVKHFDRDIQDFDQLPSSPINTRLSYNSAGAPGRYLITFKDGESQQVLKIKIVDDQRDEPNEILHLKIDSGKLTGLSAAPTNQDFTLTIVDNDAPYTGTAETYTDLLSDGGLLADECLRCHNSVLNRGGYDITHYELLVNRGILVPGDPAASLMFNRMDSNIPGLAPMPLTGLLDSLSRQRVKNWIFGGAPNN